MSGPETVARMRAWANRTRAAIAAGQIACPGDGSSCQARVIYTGNHLPHCPLEVATRELCRIERELEADRDRQLCCGFSA